MTCIIILRNCGKISQTPILNDVCIILYKIKHVLHFHYSIRHINNSNDTDKNENRLSKINISSNCHFKCRSNGDELLQTVVITTFMKIWLNLALVLMFILK